MKAFHLVIVLGNDAMQTGESVAIALRQQADYIATRYSGGSLDSASGAHSIKDANGNTVGTWQVKKAGKL